jgi:serine/threonine-protein kinase
VAVEAVFDRALEEVADGHHVDWDVSDSGAADDDERECLKWLKVLGDIAELHRSTHESFEEELAAVRSAPSPPGLPAGGAVSTWGRYELVEKVGEGSFGSVYRAWDPKLEREVALKILHPHIADTGMTERLVREGRALARIRHSNVVSVFDVETHDGRVGLCMDFVRGQTLEGVLRTQGTLSAGEAALIGQDVCRALAAVHQAGFVHRDVKARNVMREQAGRIVLMDFGTGREARALRAAEGRDVGGTPLYMAPEVLDGDPASIQSDVYSVGVLLYYLVTAGYPVSAGSVNELRQAHREGRRRFLSEVRPDLPLSFIKVIERSLAPNRQDRYANAGALLEALGSVAGETESPARRLARRLLTAGVVFISAMGILLGLGLLNSAAFNLTLGRRDFATETLTDWWIWGLRASILPLWVLALAAMARALFRSVTQAAVRLSSRASRLDSEVRRRARFWAGRLLLDDASVLASWVLMASSAGFGFVFWYFWPLISALSLMASVSPPEKLTLLSPGAEDLHDLYRQLFTYLVLATIAGWYIVLKVGSRRHQHAHRGLLAAGLAVIVLSVAFLDYPYRLLLKNEFEAVNWNGTECYVLGERSEDALLFCPGIEPPRNRVVPNKAGNLKRLGRIESIFTKFSPGAGVGAAGPDAARD